MSTNPEFDPVTPPVISKPDTSEVFIIDDAQDIFKADARYSHLTGATSDPVKDYLKQIGKVPLINAEQEVELSKRIEAGLYATHLLKSRAERDDSDASIVEILSDDYAVTAEELEWLESDGTVAKEQLMAANLRLVVSIAKRYTGRGMAFLDIIQEGNLGLIRGVEKFDYTKGYKFSTYATWWIRQSITRGIANQSRTVRIPVHMTEAILRISRIGRLMERDLGREATPEEVAKELDMTVEKVVEMQRYARVPISINTLLGEGDGAELGDLIEDTSAIVPVEAAEFAEARRVLEDVLDSYFTEREAGVLNMRFGLKGGRPMSLGEVGEVYGVTRERIRQIESKALERLRTREFKDILRDFLE